MNPELKKLLCTLFGASENATDEEIFAAGKAFAEKLATKPAAAPALEAMSTDVKGILVRLEKRDREDLVSQAAREGKVIPLSAEAIALTPLNVLTEIVSNLTPTVPLGGRIPDNVKQNDLTALSAADNEVMKRLDISEADWKKHNV